MAVQPPQTNKISFSGKFLRDPLNDKIAERLISNYEEDVALQYNSVGTNSSGMFEGSNRVGGSRLMSSQESHGSSHFEAKVEATNESNY